MRRASVLGLFAVSAAALASGLPAAVAEEFKDRITTTVRGKAVVPAEEIAVDLSVSASAESAVEAEKKYREKLARVLAALGKGDPKDLERDGKRRRKKPAADDESKTDKKKKDDDEEEPAPPPKKRKPAKPAADEDEDEPAPPKKAKKEEPKAEKKPASDDEEEPAVKKKPKAAPKADEADKPKEAAHNPQDEKKPEDKKPDEKKPDEKKPPEPTIQIEVKETNQSFGIRLMNDPNMIRQRRAMGQAGGVKEDPQIRFQSTVTVIFKDIGKLDPKVVRKRFAELLDKAVAEEAEIGIGPDGDQSPAQVRFYVTNVEALKAKAYEDAMRQARERTGALAKLAGREVGRLLSVRDNTQLPPVIRKTVQAYTNPYQYVQPTPPPHGEDTSLDVTFECDLYVEFELK